MWWKLTCKRLLLAGRTVKSTTNQELIHLLDTTKSGTSTHTLLTNEFNSRLIKNPQPPPEKPKKKLSFGLAEKRSQGEEYKGRCDNKMPVTE